VRGLRGLDLIAALRAVAAYRDRPMVVMASDENPADRRRAAEIGVEAYIRRGSFGQRRLLEAVRELVTTAAPEPTPDGAVASILIVDDSGATRRLTAGLVERLGYRARLAASGREALEQLSRQRYDMLLLDCQMPDMDGFETAAELRRREGAGRRTPIIALTADAGRPERERCLAAGMDDVLAKPVGRAELAAALQRLTAAAAPPSPEPVRAGEEPIDLGALEWVEELRELGDADEVPELFGAFFAETENRLTALREAASRHDGPALRRIAHSLKGSAGSFGAREVSQLAGLLEERLESGGQQPTGELATRIEAAFRRARAALEAHLDLGRAPG
jgi:CheY-like chemotaxis protein/HPt (histidine-containing phosphotransfer) domain-containing protein